MSEATQTYSTGLAKVTDIYAPLVARQLTANGINMSDYARQCVINAIGAINAALDGQGVRWNDPQLDTSNVTQVLLHVAALQLNAAASPREVYFQIRNVKQVRWQDGKRSDVWRKQIEMGIEGDGNDSILRRYGADIKQVGQYWLVREADDFTYPAYDGWTVTAPKWQPKGQGKVVRVVYPIRKHDGTEEYHIAEREEVIRNLLAHVSNNMQNETFGLAKDRRNAADDEKQQIRGRKAEVLAKIEELGLAALDDPELQQYMSPAWTSPQSREAMITRKMRNNVTRKIPKDFGSAFLSLVHDEEIDGEYTDARREIAQGANGEVIDLEPEDGGGAGQAPEDDDDHGSAGPGDERDNDPEPPEPAPAAKQGAGKEQAAQRTLDLGDEGPGPELSPASETKQKAKAPF